MARVDERLGPYLDGLRRRDRFRALQAGRPDGRAGLRRNGRRLINFSSNDYLGLARHPALIERAKAWTQAWGTGAGASRLVSGTYEIHQEVEEKLARWKGAEAALILNSGYQANSAILPALFRRDLLGADALVFTDRLVHASLHHGIKSAGIGEIRFRHNDLDHLESLLGKHAGRPGVRFIVTESVFSMDGDRADLAGLADLAERFAAFLYIDEAHATGVLGPRGTGLTGVVEQGAGIVLGTFGKALGSFGAYVVCSARLRDYLINRCAGFIYSTALPPSVLGAIDAALDLVPGMDAERERLHANAERLRRALAAAGLETAGSSTQIVPAVIGREGAALAASRLLEEGGVLGVAIRPPTVPEGGSRIRFALTSDHADGDMDRLLRLIPSMSELARESRREGS